LKKLAELKKKDDNLPPTCFFTEIGGYHRVRTKEFNWYFGRGSGAEEIGAGNSKEQAIKEAWEWWNKYSEKLALEGIGERRNWSENPLMGEEDTEPFLTEKMK
jgi:hypothetical protein